MPDDTIVNLHANFSMPTEEPEWWRYRHDPEPVDQRQIDAAGGFVSLPDALANLTLEPWAIDGLIPTNAQGVIFGASMTGKTFVAIDIAMSIATGLPWHLARFRALRGPVLYLAHESQAGVVKRMAAWCRYHNVRMRDDEGRLLIPAFIMQKPHPFWERSAAEALYMNIQRFISVHGAPALIVNDTFVRASVPGDENSTRDMQIFLDHCERYVREPARATLLHVHHTGHAAPGRGRGSSSIKGAMDFEYRVETAADDVIEFTCTKQKENDEHAPLYLKTRPVSLRGYNRQGKDDSSLVVERIVEDYRKTKTRETDRKLTDKQTRVLEILQARFPAGQWFATADARKTIIETGFLKGANPHDQCAKNVGALVRKGFVVSQDDWLALASVSS